MKSLINYLYFLAVLSCFQWNIDASFSRNWTKLDALWDSHRAHLHSALHHLRADLDLHLIERFPQLNASIAKLHGNIDYCYKQTVGGNETINIFKEKIHSVAVKFFKVHGNLLKNLSLAQVKQRVQYLVRNLGKFAQLLVECVEAKERGEETMTFALNHFAVYSDAEFKNQGLKLAPKGVRLGSGGSNVSWWDSMPIGDACSKERLHGETAELPESFSWRDKGYVSPVYRQGQCGSCYIFASISALESQYMISRHRPNNPSKVSQQETLNCQPGGCDGGYTYSMADYFVAKGAPKDRYGPYTGKKDTCVKHSHLIKADGHCKLFGLTEEQLQRLVMRNGPAAVGIATHNSEIKFLKDSVFRGKCGDKQSHSVMLAGWKIKDGIKVWEIKNSWGTDWGSEGYLYLPMGEKTRQCKMLQQGKGIDAVIPLIKRKHHHKHHKHHHKHHHHHHKQEPSA